MKTKLFFSLLLIIVFCNQNFSQSTLQWSTYYGGTDNDGGASVTTDVLGNIYLVGTSASISGIASGGFKDTITGSYDAFLVKFDEAGNRLWSTYYGGNMSDHGISVVTDASGDVYMAGQTTSTSGIDSNGVQNIYGGGLFDAFLVKFDSNGNRIWATYYGGTGDDQATGLAIDSLGNVYMSGNTTSTTGIASGGFQNALGSIGYEDAFIVKFDSSGNRIWATYYGGTQSEEAWGIATDIFGNVFISGNTMSSSGIASGGFQNSYGGSEDAYLVKFDSTGNRIWATYYGGASVEVGYKIVTDALGNIYMAGWTDNASGIASGGFQNTMNGFSDAILIKFNAVGNRVWATYYGGAGLEYGSALGIDAAGYVYLAGYTDSPSAVASSGFQNTYSDSTDAFLVTFTPSGNRLCASYFGGISYDDCSSIFIDALGNVYITGTTTSSTTISASGFQNTYGGGNGDAYLAQIVTCSPLSVEENKNELLLNIYPNPINQSASLEFQNQKNENYTLTIYDIQGRIVRTIKEIKTNRIEIEKQEMTSGLYFLQLQTERQVVATGKLMIE